MSVSSVYRIGKKTLHRAAYRGEPLGNVIFESVANPLENGQGFLPQLTRSHDIVVSMGNAGETLKRQRL